MTETAKKPTLEQLQKASESLDKLLSRLGVCLEQETEAVIQRNVDALSIIQAEKSALADRFKGLLKEWKTKSIHLDDFDEAQQNQIAAALNTFQSSLMDNAMALEAGQKATRRVMDRLMGFVRRAMVKENNSYNAMGRLNEKASRKPFVPTQLNETL